MLRRSAPESRTIDDPGVARQIVALGADGIMTNDPGAVVGAVRTARAQR